MAKKKNRKPSQADILHYGPAIARLKASMPRKRWHRFVKYSHRKGHTVAGQLSSAPNSLKERTRGSLRKEASRTIRTAYRPVERELTSRQRSIQYLDAKRATDDAAYRQWLTGESDKIDAQAAAADQTLASQQAAIQQDVTNAAAAAKADSLKRMQETAGNISDPNQSAALASTAAADQRTQEKTAQSRELAAALTKIGQDSRGLARGSLVAQAGANEASRRADTTKALNDVYAERAQATLKRAADARDLLQELVGRNQQNAQGQREFDLAANELGVKQAGIAADIRVANQKFRLEQKKFNLDKWTARHKALTDRAKLQLDYDKIRATDGQKAADRALRQWVETYKAKQRASENSKDRANAKAIARAKNKDKKHGIDDGERTVYGNVQTALGLIKRWHANGRVPSNEQRQHLRDMGTNDAVIDVAVALYFSKGKVNSTVKKTARRAGITHVGYFFG